MKANIYDLSGKHIGEVELPPVFESDIRTDIIRRAVLAAQSSRRQSYGTDPLAGKRTSAHYHGSRHYRFTMMNREMSRMPRIHGKVGYMAWRARFVPQAVKGRRAHPPKAEKIWTQKINKKEKAIAIRSALAAAADIELVRTKHRVDESPIIVVDDFENTGKTRDTLMFLSKIAGKELERCGKKKVRAGRGKMRGRKYRRKKGLLVIASRQCAALRALRSIAGVDAVSADNLNAELLAPGAQPGRALILTKSSLEKLQERFGE